MKKKGVISWGFWNKETGILAGDAFSTKVEAYESTYVNDHKLVKVIVKKYVKKKK